MDTTDDVILTATGITKDFPGVRALDGVHLRARRGRLLALLGENGAGKSTLMNILAGVLPPDAGSVTLDGREVRFASPRAALEHGIGMIFQELNLIPHLSVAENVFLGREPQTRSGLIDYTRLHADTRALLKRVDLNVEPETPVARLRVAQQQLVEIAKAISTDVRVLILDEPTSSLSSHEVDVLFTLIGELKRRGVALLYITHKMEELNRIGDDVMIMRDGRHVGEGPLKGYTRDDLIRLMAGREPKELFQRTLGDAGPEVFRAEKLSLLTQGTGRKRLLDGVDIDVRRGEVVGLFGLVGAGRTELLEAIFGLYAERLKGAVFIDGQPVRFNSPAEAIAAGLVLAPEDRKHDGLVLEMSVGANASLASLSRVLRFGLVDTARETAHVKPYLDRFRVKTPSLDQRIRNLSGGNQQKVILAKWLATQPKVVLLDEPTRGIDINAKREIYAFIDELAQAGLGVIVVSSEIPEILALADRIVVLCEGRRSAELSRADATPERLLHAALPDHPALAV